MKVASFYLIFPIDLHYHAGSCKPVAGFSVFNYSSAPFPKTEALSLVERYGSMPLQIRLDEESRGLRHSHTVCDLLSLGL